MEAPEGIHWLVEQGFKVSIARQTDPDEIPADVEAAFREIFREWQIPETLAFTAFPDLGTPGSEDGSPEITENSTRLFDLSTSIIDTHWLAMEQGIEAIDKLLYRNFDQADRLAGI